MASTLRIEQHRHASSARVSGSSSCGSTIGMRTFDFGYALAFVPTNPMAATSAERNGHKRTIWAHRPLGRSAAPPGSEKSG